MMNNLLIHLRWPRDGQLEIRGHLKAPRKLEAKEQLKTGDQPQPRVYLGLEDSKTPEAG